MRIEAILSNNALWRREENCIGTQSFEMKRTIGR
jgi:hypothetical protein